VLISSGRNRQERREYNEKVLEPERRVHHLGSSFERIVDEEAGRLCGEARQRGELDWELFAAAWFRVVRRVIFGSKASEDEELSSLMARLRRSANWAFLSRQRPELRGRLFERIQQYLQRAEPESLAGAMAHVHAADTVKPEQQVPQWLFAFDPAGMTTFRSLALLCAFPDHARTVRREIAAKLEERTLTRAVVLESLQLWPTTPLLLRDTTEPTVWKTGALPKGTGLIIFTPFFHRNRERLAYADRFTPELWTNGQTVIEQTGVVPFSDGPAICPGRNLVLLLASSMLTSILDHTRLRLRQPRQIDGVHPLPATLNHFRLKFELSS
jgi:cytochrome P450